MGYNRTIVEENGILFEERNLLMNETLGKRIATLRHEKGWTQEELAEKLGISAQAVSKWENDQTCPDISLLPELAGILGVSVDELLSGKQEKEPPVSMLSEGEHKDIKDMLLRLIIRSEEGSVARINLPLGVIEIAMESGMDISQFSNNEAVANIDIGAILNMAKHGAIGNILEVESANGSTIQVFIE